MFNIGGGELIVILVIALIVLGPDKLPDAVRRAGRIYGELRRMSSGFQTELRDAIDEPMREIRSTTDLVKSTFTGLADTSDPSDSGAPSFANPVQPAVEDEPPTGDADVMARVTGDRSVALPVPSGAPIATDLPSPNEAVSLPPPPPSLAADPSLPAPPGD